MDLGSALRQLRKSRNLKQIELCKKIGISATYLSQIETGLKKPSSSLLERFAAYYGMPEPAMLWLMLEESDVPEGKREFFRTCKPTMDKIIDSLFTTKDEEN